MIAIGCDHGGFHLKQEVVKYLENKGIKFIDCGTHSEASVDYPDYAKAACSKITAGECEAGILICGTGIGISMVANKQKGIRAALCNEPLSAQLTRQHNNANVLCLGGRIIGAELALAIVDAFMNTPFSGEQRHIKRINLIEN